MFGSQYAMRVWLDPRRMAALGVTARDVSDLLRANNYLAGVGQSKGSYTAINLTATTDLAGQPRFFQTIDLGAYETEYRTFALLHPGLVATEMTGGQGIQPAESAAGLIARIDELSLRNSGTFWHAEGYTLPW